MPPLADDARQLSDQRRPLVPSAAKPKKEVAAPPAPRAPAPRDKNPTTQQKFFLEIESEQRPHRPHHQKKCRRSLMMPDSSVTNAGRSYRPPQNRKRKWPRRRRLGHQRRGIRTRPPSKSFSWKSRASRGRIGHITRKNAAAR